MTPLSVRHGLRGLAAQFLALSAVFLLLQVLIQANNDAAQAGPLDPRRKRIAVSSSVDLEAIASRLPSLSEGALAATRRFRAGSAAVRGDAETVVVVMSTSNNRRQRPVEKKIQRLCFPTIHYNPLSRTYIITCSMLYNNFTFFFYSTYDNVN